MDETRKKQGVAKSHSNWSTRVGPTSHHKGHEGHKEMKKLLFSSILEPSLFRRGKQAQTVTHFCFSSRLYWHEADC